MAPYRTARAYHNAAWRARLKAWHPYWKETSMRSTLTWLWESRDQDEHDACDQLRVDQAKALPLLDSSFMPRQGRPRAKDASPHNRSLQRRANEAIAALNAANGHAGGQGVNPGANQAALQAAAAVVVPIAPAAPYVNTTVPFWPVQGDLAAPIPPKVNGNNWLGDDTLQLLPDGSQISQDDENRWHGVKVLGKPTAARVGLWVKVDDEENIIERVAIKDVDTIERERWDHPWYWRDQLPQDIAIQERLKRQNGRDTVHKYQGYRLNMADRRYRLYNEYCEYGDLRSYLRYYYEAWSTYHNDSEKIKPPEHVIPESFLWAVFRDLIDACIFLRDGADPLVDMPEGQDWRSIVHKDMHLGNVFVKPSTAGDSAKANNTEPSIVTESKEDMITHTERLCDENEYPQVVLADFDHSFFNLQHENIGYADNPNEYWRAQSPDLWDPYPPELYEQHNIYNNGLRPQINSQTDVWGIGRIMWTLLMNLRTDVPLIESHDGEPTRALTNGTSYTTADMNYVLRGQRPYESVRQYSQHLRDTVKSCLRYRPAQRAELDHLRGLVAEAIATPPENNAPGPLRLVISDGQADFREGQRWNGEDPPQDSDLVEVTPPFEAQQES